MAGDRFRPTNDKFLRMSSGLWWKYAGEALRSAAIKGRSKHRRHAVDCCCHGHLGRVLVPGMWEVRRFSSQVTWRNQLKRWFWLVTDSLCNNYRFVRKRDRLDCVLEGGGDSKAESGDLFLYSPLKVIIFVALMSGMLLLMYFFYNILGK